MPELPEVEIVAQQLSQCGIINKKIEAFEVFWPNTITFSEEELQKYLVGHHIQAVARRGKYVIFSLSSARSLIVHLRMSGRFVVESAYKERTKHEQILIRFSPALSLRFHDVRKFGKMYLVQDPSAFMKHLGIEPLSDNFTMEAFLSAVSHTKAIKTLLLDQKRIAGLGNIYADEALWLSSIHPLTPGGSLSVKALKRLHEAIPAVLRKGLNLGGTSLGEGLGNFHSVNGQVGENLRFLHVYQKRGHPCQRCMSLIEKITVSQRGTHFCPKCQRF